MKHLTRYAVSYKINPDKAGDLHYDDWHEGYKDCDDKKFPQHVGNSAYMDGWLNSLGMQAGYANVQLCVVNPNFIDGYQDAQYERHCKGRETILNFDDDL